MPHDDLLSSSAGSVATLEDDDRLDSITQSLIEKFGPPPDASREVVSPPSPAPATAEGPITSPVPQAPIPPAAPFSRQPGPSAPGRGAAPAGAAGGPASLQAPVFDPTPGTTGRPAGFEREPAPEDKANLFQRVISGGLETSGRGLQFFPRLTEAIQRKADHINRAFVEGRRVSAKGLVESGVLSQAEADRQIKELTEEFKVFSAMQPDTAARHTRLFEAGNKLVELAARVAPDAPETFIEQIAQGLGSTVPFLAVGIASGGALIPLMVSGAAITGGSLAAQAEEAGADPETVDKALALGALIGTTEGLPVAGLLNRVRRFIPGKNPAAIAGKQIAEQMLFEGTQEGVANILENDVARRLFDPERRTFEGLKESVSVGGAVGAIMEILVMAATPGRARIVSRGTGRAEQAADAEEPDFSNVIPRKPESVGDQIARARSEIAIEEVDVAEIAPSEPVAAISEPEVSEPTQPAEPSQIAPTAPEPAEAAPVQQAEQVDLSDVATDRVAEIASKARQMADETGERLFIARGPEGNQVVVAPSPKPGVAFQANFVDSQGNPAGDLQSNDFTTLLTVLEAKFGVDISSRRIFGAQEEVSRAFTEARQRGVQEGEEARGFEEHRGIEAQRAAERPGDRGGPPVRRTRAQAQEALVSQREQEIQTPQPSPRRVEGRPPVQAPARAREVGAPARRPPFPVRVPGQAPLAEGAAVGVPGVAPVRQPRPSGPARGLEPSRRPGDVPGEGVAEGRGRAAGQPDVGVPAERAVAAARGPEARARARGVPGEARRGGGRTVAGVLRSIVNERKRAGGGRRRFRLSRELAEELSPFLERLSQTQRNAIFSIESRQRGRRTRPVDFERARPLGELAEPLQAEFPEFERFIRGRGVTTADEIDVVEFLNRKAPFEQLAPIGAESEVRFEATPGERGRAQRRLAALAKSKEPISILEFSALRQEATGQPPSTTDVRADQLEDGERITIQGENFIVRKGEGDKVRLEDDVLVVARESTQIPVDEAEELPIPPERPPQEFFDVEDREPEGQDFLDDVAATNGHLRSVPPVPPPVGVAPISDPAPIDPAATTSARKVDIKRDRAVLGLDEIPSPERRTWEEALTTARDQGMVEEAWRVINRANETRTALSDVETAAVVQHLAGLKNEHARLLGIIRDPRTGDVDRSSAETERNLVEVEFDGATRALIASGTEKGRALAAQKLTLDESFDLVSILSKARTNKGETLTPAERGRLETLTSKLDSAESEIVALQEEIALASMKETVGAAKKKKRQTRKEADAELDGLTAKANRLLRAGCRTK